jgi:sigma-E factor negative regulatory protein RseC
MIEQQGRIIATSLTKASVLVGPSSGCPACDAGKGCGAGIFGRLIARKPITLELDNSIRASKGQAVVVGIPESVFLILLFWLYLLPLLAAMVGAALGHYLGFKMGSSHVVQDAWTLLTALIFAVLTLLISKAYQKRQPRNERVKLMRQADSASELYCKPGTGEIRGQGSV